MKAMWLLLALPIGTVLGVAGYAADSASDTCAAFRQIEWPKSYGKISALELQPSQLAGATPDGVEHYYNVDMDGDDIAETITKGCSASSRPADPCILDVQLSAGGRIKFEAWHLSIVRLHGRYYVATVGTDGDPDARIHRIYRIGPKAINLQCEAK